MTLENTKSGANPPKHVFGVFYDIRERADTVVEVVKRYARIADTLSFLTR